MMQQADLSVYAGMDPDDIYNSGGKSLTFFYTGTMYTQPYPINHDDMLRQDSEMFFDVFPDLQGLLPEHLIGSFLSFGRNTQNPQLESIVQQAGMDPMEVRRTGGSRGKAIKFGDALLGRVGEYRGDVVMALWQPIQNEYFQDAVSNPNFLAPIQKAFGNLSELIVVGMGNQPQAWASLSNIKASTHSASPSQSGIDTKRTDETKKKFEIDGQQYSKADLDILRGKLHNAPQMSSDWLKAKTVLCSTDLLKYTELRPYRPAICDVQDAPRLSRSQQWVNRSKELYLKQSQAGQQPSSAMLYPAWRAHSENHQLSFRDFLALNEA